MVSQEDGQWSTTDEGIEHHRLHILRQAMQGYEVTVSDFFFLVLVQSNGDLSRIVDDLLEANEALAQQIIALGGKVRRSSRAHFRQ